LVSHTRRDSDTINTDISVCTRGGREDKKTLEGDKHKKTPRGGHYKREQKKKKTQEQREERLKREGREHSPIGACTITFAFAFAR